jgi:toxin ParE1/3/4
VKITYREAAGDDLTRQFRYYLVTLGLPEIAVRFKECARKTAKAIAEHPRAGPPYRLRNSELENLRSWPVSEFEEMRFYYLVEEDVVRIIRILHVKRNVRKILESEKAAG